MTNHMRIVCFCFSLFIVTAFAQEKSMQPDLMPMPAKVEMQQGKFRLTDKFKITITGSPDKRIYPNATRALRRLAGRTGLFLPQDVLRPDVKVDSAAMTINVTRPGKIQLGEDESYTLMISSSEIVLTTPTDLGARHGLETLLQLLAADEQGYFFPELKIEDAPRFSWRGLMIDASRHFMPVEVVKRNIDGIAAVKMNVLHWHLSEDQGFRVESKIFPKLQELGSDGLYYTQEQIKDVIAYAGERGIRVVPEFDVPGHTTSWIVAYPELGSGSTPNSIERNWGVFTPVLNPTEEFTYTFLNKLFGEMAALFPDAYFHIGGDEVEGGDWNTNPRIQAFMKRNALNDNHALQAYFNNRLLKILTKHGKIMVGWDEILHETMPTNIVIQSWRGREAMVKAAQIGYQSILSNGYYIDLIHPTDEHYLNDPLSADTPLTPEQQKKILGGETTMWAEFVTPETVDSRIWPRSAAIAERFWSPREVNDVDDMYRRLGKISLQLEEHGLTHEKNVGMMLRRLTQGYDVAALENLVNVIEPVRDYNRGRLRPHTSYSPLTRVVDASRPDAPVARNFLKMVNHYFESQNRENENGQIEPWLVLWRDNHQALLPIIKASPALAEIESLSKDLSEIAAIGLEALKMIEGGQKAPDVWKQEKLAALTKAKEPRGQTELMIVSAVEKLVAAASEER